MTTLKTLALAAEVSFSLAIKIGTLRDKPAVI